MLVQLLSRTHDWFDRLASGTAGSMQAIATQEEVTSSYVTRVVYLAFLAPDIVRAMLEGRQLDSLTPDSLMCSRFDSIWQLHLSNRVTVG
ncbi:hypothetical protein [Nitrosovibrio sp. Nv17]|uniref:hypothetical protein n=1 Tax=Nitrosovibrio sp. Nv17 TaxID=1855339 RepID=UPI000908B613|nr:hypothetical protein [Nitrosovibrio sp. Nv17]SFW32238.1 hypothetical protein SAMN05216414_11643 [Nitrosovibrio sp. Nv17]